VKPSTAKRKGAATEQLLVDWLHANGYPHAERRHLAGIADRGDIAGLPGVTIEVKSGARLDLAIWMAELATEQANTGDPLAVLAIRPPGHPNPDDWYFQIDAPTLIALLRAWYRP
jgi:hypothetical protein